MHAFLPHRVGGLGSPGTAGAPREGRPPSPPAQTRVTVVVGGAAPSHQLGRDLCVPVHVSLRAAHVPVPARACCLHLHACTVASERDHVYVSASGRPSEGHVTGGLHVSAYRQKPLGLWTRVRLYQSLCVCTRAKLCKRVLSRLCTCTHVRTDSNVLVFPQACV